MTLLLKFQLKCLRFLFWPPQTPSATSGQGGWSPSLSSCSVTVGWEEIFIFFSRCFTDVVTPDPLKTTASLRSVFYEPLSHFTLGSVVSAVECTNRQVVICSFGGALGDLALKPVGFGSLQKANKQINKMIKRQRVGQRKWVRQTKWHLCLWGL